MFDSRIESLNLDNRFTVAADGQRFLINVAAEAAAAAPLSIVLNWTSLIKK